MEKERGRCFRHRRSFDLSCLEKELGNEISSPLCSPRKTNLVGHISAAKAI